MRTHNKGFGTAGIIFIVFVIGAIVAAGVAVYNQRNTNTDAYGTPVNGVEVKLENTQKENSKDEFVEVKLTVTNNSGQDQDIPWNNCAERLAVIVDGKVSVEPPPATCLIGYPPLKDGETVGRTLMYDPSDLSGDKHTMQIVISDIPSNILELNFTDNKNPIANCYEYTENITPQCGNIVIHTNVSSANPAENNQRCQKIKKQWIDGTQLQPIPSMSTMSCNEGKDAYFVANVPHEDQKMWQEKLRAANYDDEIFTEDTTIVVEKL